MPMMPVLSHHDFHADAGRRLRQVIYKLGMTQVEAASLMGVTKHVLRNWLAADHPIGTYALYRFCRAKNLDFNYVFLGDWSQLPHHLAKDLEEELTTRLAALKEEDHPEHETNGA